MGNYNDTAVDRAKTFRTYFHEGAIECMVSRHQPRDALGLHGHDLASTRSAALGHAPGSLRASPCCLRRPTD